MFLLCRLHLATIFQMQHRVKRRCAVKFPIQLVRRGTAHAVISCNPAGGKKFRGPGYNRGHNIAVKHAGTPPLSKPKSWVPHPSHLSSEGGEATKPCTPARNHP